MPPKANRLSAGPPRRPILGSALVVLALCSSTALAQTTPQSNAPASVPAGVASPLPRPAKPQFSAPPDVSAKAIHEAEDAYIRGARALDHKDLLAAEHEFTHATELNPRNRDYALALAVTREHRLTSLVQQAAAAQKKGRTAEAENLLNQARAIDPDNAVIRQHFQPDGEVLPIGPLELPSENPVRAMRAAKSRSIGGAIELAPKTGQQSVHARGGPQDVLRALCSAFGLKAEFDSSVTPGQTIRLDLESASFTEASRVGQSLTQTFMVPLQPGVAFFARDTPENRAQFQPLVEETLYMPGATPDEMNDYAKMARTVFDNLKVVNAVGSSGSLVIRGDQGTVDRVNATFADLLDDGEAEVLLDLTLYEVDSSHIVNLGAATPSSVGVFPVAAEAENLINANQSLISAAIASGQLVLTSNPYTNAIEELGLLLASGTVSSAQFTSLLGVFGHYAGLPLAGVFLGSTTTFNAMLTSSDVRILDAVQLRSGSGQDASFRAGTRYPIETGIYSSGGASSSLTSAVAGLSIGGTSVSSLLSQYLGSTSVSVPQIQFEDLGLTLKATPNVLRTSDVSLKLDFKIEALGSGTINTLPVLNNRALTSQVTIPAGQTALLASLVSRNELRSIDGLPFLSELPGFQGTEKSKEVDTTELLITLTPHVIRNRHMEVASRRLLMPQEGSQRQGGGNQEEAPFGGDRSAPQAIEPPQQGIRQPRGGQPPASAQPSVSGPSQ